MCRVQHRSVAAAVSAASSRIGAAETAAATSAVLRRRRGFTFVELCLGLVITTLVMGAMAAFSMAMASAWKSAEKTQSLTLRGHHAILRIEKEVRNARLIGASRAGSSGSKR